MGVFKIDKKILRRLVMDFYFDGEILYKKLSDGILLRCLDEFEVKSTVREVYEGICLIYVSGYVMVRKI